MYPEVVIASVAPVDIFRIRGHVEGAIAVVKMLSEEERVIQNETSIDVTDRKKGKS